MSANESNDARDAFVAAMAEGNLYQIRQASRRYLIEAKSPVRAARLMRRTAETQAPDALVPFKLALLSSFSIEFVTDFLVAHGLTEGLAIEVYHGGYDQYRQDILNYDSGLYQSAPDAVVLAVDGKRWVPELYDSFLGDGRERGPSLVENVLADVANLVRTFRAQCPAPVLLHSLLQPDHPALGVLDASQTPSQQHLIGAINRGLSDLAQRIEGLYVVDVDLLVRNLGRHAFRDARLQYFARASIAPSAMNALAGTYLRYVRAMTGRARKCLIVDLDNTLWGGVVGDEGPLGIKLGSDYPGNAFVAFQQSLLELRNRGVILAIASKNNAADVEEAMATNMAMVVQPEHFAAREIHWEPKSVSLARIAESLNIGLEHIVFVDDNPAECAEVQLAHPSVTAITLPSAPEQFVDAVLCDGFFDSLSYSAEDAARAKLYEQRNAAESLRESAASLEDYLSSLSMTVILGPVSNASVARASQMTQKTNQFNTTTRRYSESEIAVRMQRDDWITLTARVSDRFGDNGIVLLAMAECQGDVFEIDTFLMSCRVIGRTVETAVLHRLCEAAAAAGASAIRGDIFVTPRNTPVRDMFARHGFEKIAERGENSTWQLQLPASLTIPEWLEVIDENG